MNDDTTAIKVLPLTDAHADALTDLEGMVGTVRRALAGWDGRKVGGDPGDRSEALAYLARAEGALGRLTAAAESLRSELGRARQARDEARSDVLGFDAIGAKRENDALVGDEASVRAQVHAEIESRRNGGRS